MALQSDSGVSWLHERLLTVLKERREFLRNAIASGVPMPEYRQMVGRHREVNRMIDDTIPELFVDFYQSDAEEDLDE